MESQLFRNPLKCAELLGIKITGGFIWTGLYGTDLIEKQLNQSDVISYYEDFLCSNEPTDEIVSLVCNKDDPQLVDCFVEKLVQKEEVQPEIELRKWRVYGLNKLLSNLGEEPLDGLLNLIEFWQSAKCGFVESDCPQVFPTKDTVYDYFSKEMLENMIRENYKWLDEEIQYIAIMEKDKSIY